MATRAADALAALSNAAVIHVSLGCGSIAV